MSKVLSVENGNYIVKVESGKNIILDTSRGEIDSNGDLVGEVIVNGGLLVKGTTTTVNSQNLNVYDNIVVINKYENPSGIDGIIDNSNRAGIEIDRGDWSRVRMVFDESIAWTNGEGTSTRGTFTFEDDDFIGPIPIYIGGVKTPGKFFIDASDAITTELIPDYKKKVLNYSGNNLVEINNNVIKDYLHIPNMEAVADYVEYAFTNIGTGAVIEAYDTKVQAHDFDIDSTPSRVDHFIDGNIVFTVYSSTIDTQGLTLDGPSIRPKTNGNNLTLRAPGQSQVQIDDVLELTTTPHADDPKIDPEAPSDGIRIYSKPSNNGGTGLYFINDNEIQDEFISRNRSIVYSLIF